MSHIRTNQRQIKEPTQAIKSLPWKQWLLPTSITLACVFMILSGLYALNQRLSVQHWNITAPIAIKTNINHVLTHVESLDFWHSRPAYLRQILLKRIPDLADVHIQRQLPSTLIIHITERQAIALWLNNTNNKEQLYLVDEQGHAYRARQDHESSNLPVLRMQQKDLAAACQWLAILKKEQPQWFERSSEMIAERHSWKLNLVSGQQWRLPLGLRGLQTITQLSNILKQPRWHTGNWRVDTRLQSRWFIRPATHEGVI